MSISTTRQMTMTKNCTTMANRLGKLKVQKNQSQTAKLKVMVAAIFSTLKNEICMANLFFRFLWDKYSNLLKRKRKMV